MLNIIVTGASRGIGLCLCKMLHQKGYNVIGIYNKTKIDDALFDTYKCDIKNEKEIISLYTYVIGKYKKIDVLINCAAISLDNDIYDKSKDEFMEVLEVNLVGTFLMCKYASLNMDNGIIINISSTDASTTYGVLEMDYASSKAGLENLTKNLANRFPNLKICALAPNWVLTETILNMNQDYLKEEMRRVGQKELLKKEDVALKVIDIINNDIYKSGDIVRMDGINE